MVEAPTVYDWTGFYVGGNIGYAFEGGGDDVGISSNVGVDWPKEKVNFGSLNISGITGGAQIGADWQAGSAVFGIVADVQAADINDDFKSTRLINDQLLATKAEDKVDWWGTIRGRLGWAFNNVLIYGTGGVAWGDVNYDVTTFSVNDDPDGVEAAHLSDNYTEWGWTAGGGLDWAIDEHWIVGGEVLYVNLGEKQISGRSTAFADTGEVLRTDATPDFWVARFLVNFKF